MFHEILGCTTDAHWLNNVFLFSTEIWAEQLEKKNLYVGKELLGQLKNDFEVHHYIVQPGHFSKS